MRQLRTPTSLLLLGLLLGLGVPAAAQVLRPVPPGSPGPGEDGPAVSNGGYMQTTGPDGQALPLPLLHTDVQAEIAGFLASVKVKQTFGNSSDRPIEAVYVFPLPERSAVRALTLHVGRRVIRGTIQKREDARRIYEDAKAAGKTAALLDQERPNLFTQAVANILPGEQIEVELTYVEDLKFQHGEYEFVFPLVVGPRFVGGGQVTGRQGTGWAPDSDRIPDASRITPPLLPPGTRPGHDVAISVTLDAGMAIEGLASPSHQLKIARPSTEEAQVTLAPSDTLPNRDFVLRYRIAGKAPRVALLTERDAASGYFLLMIQPRLPGADAPIAPREFVFVIDTSGSMYGFPLEQAKQVIRSCLGQVGPQDTFQVIGFSGSASFLFPSPQAPTKKNVELALARVEQLRGGGGTQFIPALDLALNARRDPGRARTVLFLSDGYIGYENEVLRYLRSNLRQANLFAMGVGSSVNRFLIEGMARVGQGEPFYLLRQDQPAPIVQRFYEYVSRPSLTDITLDWGGLDVQDATPGLLADLFAERPLFLVGRYERGGRGKVTVRGRYAGAPYQETISVELPEVPHGVGAGISSLWARRTIEEGMDVYRLEPQRKAQAQAMVTDLALRYHLMSEFTSFVAVDEVVRTDGSAPQTVPVAVPLPEGVSPLAAPAGAFVGGASQAPPVLKRALSPEEPRPTRSGNLASPRKPAPAGAGDAAAAPAPGPPPPPAAFAPGALGYGGIGVGRGGGGIGNATISGGVVRPNKKSEAKGKAAAASQAEAADVAVPQPVRPGETVALGPPGARLGDAPAAAPLVQSVQAQLPTLLPAYREVLASDGWARGPVTVRLELGAGGKVLRATVVAAPFGGKLFRDALARLLAGWTLAGAPAAPGQVLQLTLVFGG